MGWTVYNSDGKILQSAELGDNAVTSAKIADGAILNADINASAAIAKTKLASLDVVNADVNASAAVALSKLATTTVSRALVSDGSGVISPSAVTSTEIGYLDGVTSAIQTQINAAGGLSAASEAEMVAGSSNTVAATPGRTHFHPAVAKAWANINAAGDTLMQDFGCASVSRISTGKYRTVVVAMAASNVFFGATNSVAGDDIVTFNMSTNTQLDSYVLRAGSVSNIGHSVLTFGEFA